MIFGGVIILGAAYTLKHNKHVRVDLVYSRMGDRYKQIIDLIGSLFFLMVMCFFVTWDSFIDAQQALRVDERTTDGKIPRVFIYSVIPMGFFLLFLEGSVVFFKSLFGLMKVDLEDDTPAVIEGEGT